MTQYESTDLVISILAALTNLGALAFIGYQVVLARQSNRAAYRLEAAEAYRRAQQATLDYYTQTLMERNRLSADVPPFWKADEVDLFIARAATDPTAHQALTNYLGYWELLASGVNIGIYDLPTIRRIAGSRVVGTWDAWSPYVTARRLTRGNAKLYSELEALAKALREQP